MTTTTTPEFPTAGGGERPCWQHPHPPAGHDTIHDPHPYPSGIPGLSWQCPGRATLPMLTVREIVAEQARDCAHPNCHDRIDRGETYARVTTDGRTEGMHLECAMVRTGGGPTDRWWTARRRPPVQPDLPEATP